MTKIEAIERLNQVTFFLKGSVSSADLVNAFKRMNRVVLPWSSAGGFQSFPEQIEAFITSAQTLTRVNYPGDGLKLKELISNTKVGGEDLVNQIISLIQAFDGDKSPTNKKQGGGSGPRVGPRMLQLADTSYYADDLAKKFLGTNYSMKLIEEGRDAIKAWVDTEFVAEESERRRDFAVRRIASSIAHACDSLNTPAPASDGEVE